MSPCFLSPFILKGADPADAQWRILCKSGTDARSRRATGAACPTLVGQKAGICDSNATRNVTSLLTKSGMAMNVRLETLASRLRFATHSQVTLFKFMIYHDQNFAMHMHARDHPLLHRFFEGR